MERLAFGLFAQKTSEGLELSGRTFDNKDRLKALGARWNPDKKVWVLPLEADLGSLAYVPPPKKTKQRVVATTRYLACDRVYICAKKVATFNPTRPDGPMIYVCDCHPTFYSSYDGT
jgi:hypothetical protein